jgi:hypothetical protein
VIQDVARPKFSEAEEPRPFDGVRLIARGDRRPKRQAREVVARDEPLAREVPVRVELGVGGGPLVQQEFDLAQGLALASLRLLAFRSGQPRHVDAPPRCIPLLDRRAVELAPSIERLIERCRRAARLLLKPLG